MAGPQADDLLDLMTTSQRNLGRFKWTDLSFPLQRYIVLPRLLREEKVIFAGGTGLQWNVTVGTSGNARMTGLFPIDNRNIANVHKTAYVEWRHNTTNWAIERREIRMNGGPECIVDLMTSRRADAMTDNAKLLERIFWQSAAATAGTDDYLPVTYWVVWTDNSSTNPNGGFDGGNPSGYSAGAGNLSSTTYPMHSNWCAKYAAITKNDFVAKLRRASDKCNFTAPVPTPGYGTGEHNYGYYTNLDMKLALETIGEANNDNLGFDIDPAGDNMTFRKTGIVAVPALDDRTGVPFYGLDWDQFHFGFLSGEYLVESGVKVVPGMHTTYGADIDTTLNTRCTDRRCNFVLSKSSDV